MGFEEQFTKIIEIQKFLRGNNLDLLCTCGLLHSRCMISYNVRYEFGGTKCVCTDQRCESTSGGSGISKAGKEGDARVNRGAM